MGKPSYLLREAHDACIGAGGVLAPTHTALPQLWLRRGRRICRRAVAILAVAPRPGGRLMHVTHNDVSHERLAQLLNMVR